MKNILFILSLCLVGCGTSGVKEQDLSTGTLSDVKAEEIGKVGNYRYIKVSGNYSISNFKDKPGAYSCKVIFTGNKGAISLRYDRTPNDCVISSESGVVTATWPIPEIKPEAIKDGVWGAQELYYPVNYVFGIYQNTGGGRSSLLAQSQVFIAE